MLINLFTKFVHDTNIFILSFLTFYSCSTNSPQVQYLHFESDIKIKEVIVHENRYILSPDMVKYVSHSKRAERFFDYLVNNPDIIKRDTFDYSIDTKEIVLIKIKQTKGLIIAMVDKYYPVWRFSSILAYQDKNNIYFNGYKLKRSECDLVDTFVHEYLHRLGYGHGDNSSTGKQNSVPYYFGELARQECEKKNI